MKYTSEVWGKYYFWHPENVAYPATIEELRETINEAKKKGIKIRMAGSLHSLNELCKTSGLQLFTDRLNKILEIDKTNLTVRVEGGIKIRDLQESLAKNGMSLPNQGYIDEQSIAGALATATHGSGKTGTFCSFVEEIDLLDAEGALHRLSPTTDPHLFSAALVHLGCLGVIYAVKLKCILLPKLELSKVRGNIKNTLKELRDLLNEYDYFQIVLDPYNDQLFTWRYKKTDAELKYRRWYRFRSCIIKFMAVLTMDYLRPPDFLMPYLLKFYMFMSPLKRCVEYSHRILSPADEGHYVEEEIAVPIEHFEKALSAVRNVIDDHSKRKKRPVAIILIRFALPDPYGYLSPALNKNIAYFSLITISKEGYVELFKDFENSLVPFQGMPHWGKIHFMTKELIRTLYKENYTKFVEAKRKLDPEGLFSNEYIDNFFNEP